MVTSHRVAVAACIAFAASEDEGFIRELQQYLRDTYTVRWEELISDDYRGLPEAAVHTDLAWHGLNGLLRDNQTPEAIAQEAEEILYEHLLRPEL